MAVDHRLFAHGSPPRYLGTMHRIHMHCKQKINALVTVQVHSIHSKMSLVKYIVHEICMGLRLMLRNMGVKLVGQKQPKFKM